MRRFLTSVGILVLMVVPTSTATVAAEGSGDDGRIVEANYYGPQPLYEYRSCPPSGGAGCLTVETRPNESLLTAKAVDAHGQPVAVWVVDASETAGGLDGPNSVYGVFCGETAGAIRFDPGATLELWIGGEWFPRWWGVPDVECVPGVATTGTVRATLSGDAPSPAQPARIERSVDLGLRGHLRTSGKVRSDDPSCRSNVPVVVQRRAGRDWVEVGSATTRPDGTFALKLNDRGGRYRAIASEVAGPERICAATASAVTRHRHSG